MEGATTEKVYQTTYEQCRKTISGVCSCCGGELKPLETVDNSGNPTWWAGCEPCSRFDAGVSPEIYAIAKYLVDETGYVSYSHMRSPKPDNAEYAKYYRASQICGAASLVDKIFRIQNRLSASKTAKATT